MHNALRTLQKRGPDTFVRPCGEVLRGKAGKQRLLEDLNTVLREKVSPSAGKMLGVAMLSHVHICCTG